MTNAQHSNENLTIHLKVKDYAIWRTGYDGREKSRVSAGITNGRVFRHAEDQNDVVILQESPTWQRHAPGWPPMR